MTLRTTSTRTDIARLRDLRPHDALLRCLDALLRLDGAYRERAALREMPDERLRDMGLRRMGGQVCRL
jgi:uncharacterized protein YjiS (DUF1127 family)